VSAKDKKGVSFIEAPFFLPKILQTKKYKTLLKMR
jgi:hypothetical protein